MAGMLVGWLLRRAGAQSLPDNKAANYGETAATTCTRMASDFEAEVGAAEIGMVVLEVSHSPCQGPSNQENWEHQNSCWQ